MLGEYDEFGVKIGGTNADKMWFLLNREEAIKFKAFRIFTLWSNQIKMFQNDNTDAFITKLTVHFGCDRIMLSTSCDMLEPNLSQNIPLMV